MKNFASIFLVCVFLSGCAAVGETLKCVAGISTKELENHRDSALVKVFDYDYDTCYSKMESVIKDMPKTEIYARDKQMIAVYYTDPNITTVGIFFTGVDSSHTRVEVSSEGPAAREWVARNLFSEKALPATPDSEYSKEDESKRDRVMLSG